MGLKSIQNLKNPEGRRIIVRVDLNVPIKNRKVEDDTKIIKSLPTIKYLSEKGAIVILISHLGRPKIVKSKKPVKSKFKNECKFNFNKDLKYSLKPVAATLENLLGKKAKLITDCIGVKVEKQLTKAEAGDIFLLENIRFYDEEKKGNKTFAKKLAGLGEIYVNDAFAVSHRDHASVLQIRNYLPSYKGFLLGEELANLEKARKAAKKPYVILLGGAKLSTKIRLIKKLNKSASKILIGGAMANVFLAACGYEIGKSLVEKKMIAEAKKLMKNKKIILPRDVIVSNKASGSAKAEWRNVNEVKKNEIILDIGPKTIKEYAKLIKKAKTILWNGPMGMFEYKQFSSGSLILARTIASVSSGRAYGVCGGGETIDILNRTKMEEFVDWVSTGGGAMLSFLSGEKMPAIK